MIDKAKRYGEGAFFIHLCEDLGLAGSPQLIRHNTNLIYDCGEFIVRLTPNSFRSREEVLRELHWMQFVGSRTPDVVSVIGESATDTRQFMFEGEHFTVTLLEKIIGKPITAEQWNASHFERLGALTGFLHKVGQEYRAPNDEAELTEWDSTPEACLAHELPEDERALPDLNQRVFDHMAAMPRDPARYGPIHYDIHPGNYLITADNRLVLFDFENSCRGHYINDIAVVLYYSRIHKLSTVDEGFNRDFLEAFWKGYTTAYHVPEEDIEHIPWLLLNRSLIVLGYLYKIWPGEKTEEQEHYIARVDRSIEDARANLQL